MSIASASSISLDWLPERPPIPPRSAYRPRSNRQSKVQMETYDFEQPYYTSFDSVDSSDIPPLPSYTNTANTTSTSSSPSKKPEWKTHQRNSSEPYSPPRASNSRTSTPLPLTVPLTEWRNLHRNKSIEAFNASASPVRRSYSSRGNSPIRALNLNKPVDGMPTQAEPARAARATVCYIRPRSGSNPDLMWPREGEMENDEARAMMMAVPAPSTSAPGRERSIERRGSAPSTYERRRSQQGSMRGMPSALGIGMPVMMEEENMSVVSTRKAKVVPTPGQLPPSPMRTPPLDMSRTNSIKKSKSNRQAYSLPPLPRTKHSPTVPAASAMTRSDSSCSTKSQSSATSIQQLYATKPLPSVPSSPPEPAPVSAPVPSSSTVTLFSTNTPSSTPSPPTPRLHPTKPSHAVQPLSKVTHTLPPTPPSTPPSAPKKSSLRSRRPSSPSPTFPCEELPCALKRMFGSNVPVVPLSSIESKKQGAKEEEKKEKDEKDENYFRNLDRKARTFSYSELPPTVRRKFLSPSDAALALESHQQGRTKPIFTTDTRPETPILLNKTVASSQTPATINYYAPRVRTSSLDSKGWFGSAERRRIPQQPPSNYDSRTPSLPVYYDDPETRRMLKILKEEWGFDEVVRRGFNGGKVVTMRVTMSRSGCDDDI